MKRRSVVMRVVSLVVAVCMILTTAPPSLHALAPESIFKETTSNGKKGSTATPEAPISGTSLLRRFVRMHKEALHHHDALVRESLFVSLANHPQGRKRLIKAILREPELMNTFLASKDPRISATVRMWQKTREYLAQVKELASPAGDNPDILQNFVAFLVADERVLADATVVAHTLESPPLLVLLKEILLEIKGAGAADRWRKANRMPLTLKEELAANATAVQASGPAAPWQYLQFSPGMKELLVMDTGLGLMLTVTVLPMISGPKALKTFASFLPDMAAPPAAGAGKKELEDTRPAMDGFFDYASGRLKQLADAGKRAQDIRAVDEKSLDGIAQRHYKKIRDIYARTSGRFNTRSMVCGLAPVLVYVLANTAAGVLIGMIVTSFVSLPLLVHAVVIMTGYYYSAHSKWMEKAFYPYIQYRVLDAFLLPADDRKKLLFASQMFLKPLPAQDDSPEEKLLQRLLFDAAGFGQFGLWRSMQTMMLGEHQKVKALNKTALPKKGGALPVILSDWRDLLDRIPFTYRYAAQVLTGRRGQLPKEEFAACAEFLFYQAQMGSPWANKLAEDFAADPAVLPDARTVDMPAGVESSA